MTDGLKFLMDSVNADNTVICLGTGAIQCKDDSVALDRSAAQLNYEQMLALLKAKKQSTKVAPFKEIVKALNFKSFLILTTLNDST